MESKFEITVTKKDLPKIDIERLYKWMQDMGEDFIDYHFDIPIRGFKEFFDEKYPHIKEEFDVNLKEQVRGHKGPVLFTFMDVLNVYEILGSNIRSDKKDEDLYEIFYEDLVEYCNMNEELNKIMHNTLDQIKKKET